MKILFAPAHYLFSAKIGSEIGWSYNIVSRIADICLDTLIISGCDAQSANDRKYKVIGLSGDENAFSGTATSSLGFHIRTFSVAWLLLRRANINIVHHVLPFAFDKTFNLLALTGLLKHRSFVIGPIQTPLEYSVSMLPNEGSAVFSCNSRLFRAFTKISSIPFNVMSNITLRRADAVIAITEFAKEMLIDRGVESNRIYVIHPGIDIDQFQFVPYEDRPTDTFELIAPGLLVKRKGLDIVLDALAKLPRVVRLLVVGDGPERSELEKKANLLNLTDRVKFIGKVPYEDMRKLYAKCHVLVSASRAESWGQIYVEAMATGLPVVACRNVGSQSIVQHNKTGILVDPEDPGAFAEGIASLLKSPTHARSMGQSARRQVEETYDWNSIIIPKYLEVYRKLGCKSLSENS